MVNGIERCETDRYPAVTALAQNLGQGIAILDTETTGFPEHEPFGLVELGGAIIEPSGETYLFNYLINPGFPIPAEASKIHGIRDEHVADAPGMDSLGRVIERALDNRLLSGFNTRQFDQRAINTDMARNGYPIPEVQGHLDVRDLWSYFMQTQQGKLFEVAEAYGVQVKDEHRAIGDVQTTAGILDRMVEHHGLETITELAQTIRQDGGQHLETPASPPDLPGKGQRARIDREIRSRLASTDPGEPVGSVQATIKQIGRSARANDIGVEMRLQDWLRAEWLDPVKVTDPDAQERLSRHLPEVVEEIGSLDRLKPIKQGVDDRLTQEGAPAMPYLQISAYLKMHPEIRDQLEAAEEEEASITPG